MVEAPRRQDDDVIDHVNDHFFTMSWKDLEEEEEER
jgi:hypothetical protein